MVWRGPRALPARPNRVALTFDDGPTPLTLDYVDALERCGVRATFFVVGEQCAKQPELVSALAAAGHELAGHGYTHRRFTSLSRAQLRDELWRTRDLLPAGKAARSLVRPPHGSGSLATLAACASEGFTTVLWSLNSGDWRDREPSALERAVQADSVEPGEIVLFHEGQPWTLNALPAIVDGLKKAGHELVTVGELLA